jgi:hypothetical protein
LNTAGLVSGPTKQISEIGGKREKSARDKYEMAIAQ